MKKKVLIIISFTVAFFFIMKFLFIIGILFNKIESYTYLKINNENKKYVVDLLKEQENDMFRISGDIKLELCYSKLNKIEVIYNFPDSESYTLYCNDERFYFTIDNSSYELPNYLGKNGKKGYRLK